MYSDVPQTRDEIVAMYAKKESHVKTVKTIIDATNDMNYAFDIAGLYFEGNRYGTLLQTWLERKYGWANIPQVLNEGDFNSPAHDKVELKISLIRKDSTSAKANFLNLRLESDAKDYLFIARNTILDTTKIYFLPKKEVIYIVDMYEEGIRSKHAAGMADLRVCVEGKVFKKHPKVSCRSYLSQFEIAESELENI
jgi:hypothetical protein